MFTIQISQPIDLEVILGLYQDAVKYQKEKGYNLWPEFEKSLVEKEIRELRHYKITEADKIACVFSALYSDPIIWGEKDKDPAIYLHRIATNHNFKGNGMMRLITNWARQHSKLLNMKFIRVDTWSDNENLKNYYLNFGFQYMRQVCLPENHELPSHYWGLTLSLFEIKI